VPQFLRKAAPGALSTANWWVPMLLALAALIFYVFSLRATSSLLSGRRERLMAIVEGRA